MQDAELRRVPLRKRRWVRRLAIGSGLGLVLFTLVGFFVLPPIARHVAQKQLATLLGRRVTIARIRLNPFALSLTVEGLQVYEPDRTTPFFGFGRLYVNAQLSSIIRRGPVIKEIALDSLRLHVVRTRATPEAWADIQAAYNFSDILARLTAGPPAPGPPAPASNEPPRFSLNNIHFRDWAVRFDDQPTGDHHEVTDLSIGVPFASTLPVYIDSFVEPGLSVRIDGTPFAIQGRTKPFTDSLETVLELRLRALDLTRYLPFVPVRLPVSIKSAKLTLALDVGFVRPRQDAARLTVEGDVSLDGIDVHEKRKGGTSPLLALQTLSVHLDKSDVTAQRFHVGKVIVSGLDVHLRRQRDGTLNVEHLAPPEPPSAPPARRPAPQPTAPALRFALDQLALDKTTIHFRDDAVEPAFVSEVRDVAVSVRGLSNAPGVTAKVEAGLRAVPGATIAVKGTLRLTPLAATGRLTVDDVEPAKLAPYYRDLVAFDVTSGKIELAASYVFEQERARTTVRLDDGSFGLEALVLRRRGARDDFFRLGTLEVRGAKLDLGARTVSVDAIATREGRVRAARDAKGIVDLTTLVPPAPATPGAAPPPPAPAPAAPAWKVSVAKFDLERWGARFDDRGVSPAVVLTVDPITLHLTDLSTAPGARLGLELRLGINRTGKLQVAGTATPLPATALAANLRFDLHGIEILPFQPYFQQAVSLSVTSGTLGVKGQATVKTSAKAQAQVDATIDLDVDDLATVDRANQEPLVKWKAFHVGTLKLSTAPLAVAIGDVSLTDLQSRLIMSQAGLNLQQALEPPGSPRPKPIAAKPTAAARPAPASAPMAMTIGRVTLNGAQVTFTDRTIQPPFTADLAELGGSVSGLSSTPGTTADIDLRGTINRSGALTIQGKVNPLAKELALDAQVNLRDVELPPASPYTGRYAGYLIGKGKLGLSLGYKIAARRLEASNRLVLDQFTFGDKVDSPDATHMPVRLAVAILKDRKGVIDIALPIAGSLDDPDFKIWGAVLKVFGNLIVKAATAPFSLIASAFGGGDELSHVDFAAGTAKLDPVAKQRLATLARVLRERPGISFELEGGADPARDREGLRRFLFERTLKARKLAALVNTGAAVASIDDVDIAETERPALLDAAYRAAKFAKPKNGLGLEKGLPPSDQEKLLLANTGVEDDELRALALRRATAVESALAKEVPGTASRLFLVSPRLAGGRVELKLKKD